MDLLTKIRIYEEKRSFYDREKIFTISNIYDVIVRHLNILISDPNNDGIWKIFLELEEYLNSQLGELQITGNKYAILENDGTVVISRDCFGATILRSENGQMVKW